MEARAVEVFSSTLHFDASAVVVVHFVPQEIVCWARTTKGWQSGLKRQQK